MNFQVYYDSESGLIGGNLKFANSQWTREAYNFSNFGSEARLLYSVGWALGLFPDERDSETFLPKAAAALKVELMNSSQGDLLKLWDGSAFQLYFPKMFVAEENYSPELAAIYKAHLNYMIAEGQRRRLQVPAAHSAGRSSKEDYKDKSGNRELVSSDNRDLQHTAMGAVWDDTFHPYVLFMALTADPTQTQAALAGARSIQSGSDPLYSPALGWMDGLHVSGPSQGLVVPAQLSLNQGMIALAILQMQSRDGMGLSARKLFQNANARRRLQEFYDLFAAKLAK